MTKKKTVKNNTLPGLDSDVTKHTLNTLFLLLNKEHLEYLKEDINLRFKDAKGALKTNVNKINTYLDNVFTLKNNVKDIPQQQTQTVKQETPKKGFTQPTRVAEPSVALFKAVEPPGKGAAPATKQSFIVAEETNKTVPTNTRRITKKTENTDILEKLGNSELERFKKLPIAKCFPYARIVKVNINNEPTKVIVIGTALGYKITNYYNVNCTINGVLASATPADALHKNNTDNLCFYSSKQVVPNKKFLEYRYIRLLKYQDGMQIRFWLHNVDRNYDEESRILEVADDKILVL